MNSRICALSVIVLAVWLTAIAQVATQASASGPTAQMVVTAEARHGSNVPAVEREDVLVHEGHDRDQVVSWIPAQGDHAALELYILLDDGSNISLGSQLDEIRQFIQAQPPTTTIGIAYMQNGTANVVQALTNDRVLASKALKLPTGIPGINGSPYFALSDLIKKWPQTGARHEVLLVTDGIDRYYGSDDLQDPYVNEAIEQAQRAGVIVYAIYTPGTGHEGHSYWRTYGGQLYLSRVADQTGGEAYSIGFQGAPVSFAPYLDDLSRRLGRQYLLTFVPKTQKKSGMQRIKLSTEVPNVELVSAESVYVPATE